MIAPKPCPHSPWDDSEFTPEECDDCRMDARLAAFADRASWELTAREVVEEALEEGFSVKYGVIPAFRAAGFSKRHLSEIEYAWEDVRGGVS